MNTYVVFTSNNARILKNPSDDVLAGINPSFIVLKNPKRIDLDGVPPHFWIPDVQSNSIHPMSFDGKIVRALHINSFGADNNISGPLSNVIPLPEPAKFKIPWKVLAGAGAGAALLEALHRLFG